MVERREKEEVHQGLCVGHRKQRPLFPFVVCMYVCVGVLEERMAGLCRANEEREGSRSYSVYSHVPCRLSSGGSAVHTQNP